MTDFIQRKENETTRVLVTGGTGFVGSAVLRQIADDDTEVHVISSRAAAEVRDKVILHQADLLEPKEVADVVQRVRPTHLLHLAWDLSKGVYESPSNFSWLRASYDLVREFRENGGRRALVAGTCFEYDPASGYCTEEYTPTTPPTVYGQAKDILRQWLESYARVTGLDLAWARIFFVYGPEEAPNRLVPSVVQSLLEDKPALCSHGEQVRDYLHVDDVASACLALLHSEVRGPVNVASGDPIRLREIIYLIADELDRHDLVRLGARETSPSEPDLLVANTQRLQDEVAWNPTFSLHEGLRNTIRWWAEHARVTQRTTHINA